jgi:hypothetical protein
MQRGLAIAALGSVLLITPLWGQRGGHGGMAIGGAGHTGSVPHGGGGFSHGPVHGGAPSGWGWRHPSNGYPYRHAICPGRYLYRRGYPGNYGYGWYSYPGWGFSAVVGDSYAYPDQAYPSNAYEYPNDSSAYAENIQIQQDEIDRLSHVVDRLLDRESREAEMAPSRAQPKAQSHGETVLVFRDKHTEEIQNYAIVGNTLWIFTELRARKVSIASLDVPATTKANDDRGVDFQLPK